jgi:hypothetical protein
MQKPHVKTQAEIIAIHLHQRSQASPETEKRGMGQTLPQSL